MADCVALRGIKQRQFVPHLGDAQAEVIEAGLEAEATFALDPMGSR